MHRGCYIQYSKIGLTERWPQPSFPTVPNVTITLQGPLYQRHTIGYMQWCSTRVEPCKQVWMVSVVLWLWFEAWWLRLDFLTLGLTCNQMPTFSIRQQRTHKAYLPYSQQYNEKNFTDGLIIYYLICYLLDTNSTVTVTVLNYFGALNFGVFVGFYRRCTEPRRGHGCKYFLSCIFKILSWIYKILSCIFKILSWIFKIRNIYGHVLSGAPKDMAVNISYLVYSRYYLEYTR